MDAAPVPVQRRDARGGGRGRGARGGGGVGRCTVSDNCISVTLRNQLIVLK